MAITYEPRLGLPNWSAGADNPTRGQFDAAFAALGNLAARGEQGPLSQLPPPAAPTTATATVGGTLAPATYGYRITALSAAAGSFAAGETTPSAEVTRVVPAGTNTNTVTLNWVAVPGATGYRIYGRAAGAELLLATVGAVTTWTDTGANVPAGAMPGTNTTAGRPAPGIRNRTYWASDDRGGRLSYDDGGAWYDLGPGPVTGPQAGSTALIVGHASAATSDAVLIARGKTGQTGDLLKLQDPTAATDLLRVASSGALFANAGATITPATAAGVPVTVKGLTSQTGDLTQWKDPTGATTYARIGPNGGLFANAGATVAPVATSSVALIVNGLASQTADLFQAQVNGASVASVAASGALSAIGTAKLGVGALGGTGGYQQITTDTTANVIQQAQHSGADANALYRIKGGGGHYFQGATGLDWLSIGADHTYFRKRADGTTLAIIDGALGGLSALGDSYIGANALGATGTRLRVGSLGDAANAWAQAEGTPTNVGLILAAKGTGSSGGTVTLRTNNTNQWWIDASGNLVSSGAGNAAMTFTGNGVIALHNAGATPFSTPTLGGVLYVSAGALRYRGSAGTDSLVAAA